MAVSVYYGLTNTLHLGAVARLGGSKNALFDPITVQLSDGSTSSGRLYEDHLGLWVSALALYRFNTGRSLAPVLSAEVGFAQHSYKNLQHVPTGALFSIYLPDTSETIFVGRIAALAQYRFSDHFVGSTGVALTLAPRGLTLWQLSVPLEVGVVRMTPLLGKVA